MPKLLQPPDPLPPLEPADIVAVEPHSDLWRIARTAGPRVTPWNRLRTVGPVTGCRFDPHPEPLADGSGEGVLYLALDVPTAVAEAYGAARAVDRLTGAPYVIGLRLTRAVRLLDLSGSWPTRAGASQAISSSPRRDVTRAWARAVRRDYAWLDGLWYPSSMHGGRPCVVLFTPAADALPELPEVAEPLAHPDLADSLAAVCADLGYRLQ